jgi:hypothetical protein
MVPDSRNSHLGHNDLATMLFDPDQELIQGVDIDGIDERRKSCQ